MLTWILNICLYLVVDVPGNACRAGRRFASDWWYSHYQ